MSWMSQDQPQGHGQTRTAPVLSKTILLSAALRKMLLYDNCSTSMHRPRLRAVVAVTGELTR